MRLHRFLAALLLGLPMATPIPVAAEDAPLAPEVQRRVAVVVLARRIRGYAAMAKASSDCQVEKGRLPRRQASHCLLYTSPSPRDSGQSRMPSSA